MTDIDWDVLAARYAATIPTPSRTQTLVGRLVAVLRVVWTVLTGLPLYLAYGAAAAVLRRLERARGIR